MGGGVPEYGAPCVDDCVYTPDASKDGAVDGRVPAEAGVGNGDASNEAGEGGADASSDASEGGAIGDASTD